MKLLNLFGKKGKKDISPRAEEVDHAEKWKIYSGMRVEVTTDDGYFLFVAKLQGLRGNEAQLHMYSEAQVAQVAQSEEARHVRIRGYSDHEKKAVYMEGFITPGPEHIWQVKELVVVRIDNDRAFFRLTTDIDATATMFSGLAMGEKPCRLLNISVGGACISSQYIYHENDKFLLKARLLEDRPESAMFCQVLRVTQKDESKFEYGCKFLELTEEDQERITQNIFAAQVQKRKRS